MKFRKVIPVLGKRVGDYREADARNINLLFDQRRKKITYRVQFSFVVKNKTYHYSGGRYEDFGTAIMVRDIMSYLLPYKQTSIKRYYDEMTLQKEAIKRKRKDIGELLQFLKNKHDISVWRKE